MGSESEEDPPEYAIGVLKNVPGELAKLPARFQRDVANAINGLKKDQRPPGSKQLEGYERPSDQPPIHRIVVGKQHVIYRIKDHLRHVTILKVGERGTVYLDFGRQMGRGTAASTRRRRR